MQVFSVHCIQHGIESSIGVASSARNAMNMAADFTPDDVAWNISEQEVVELLQEGSFCQFRCSDGSQYKMRGFKLDEQRFSRLHAYASEG